jgi:hypothetical protein
LSVAAPETTRYTPEELLVCKSATIPGNAEWEVDAWRKLSPKYAVFQYFYTEPTVGAKIRVTADTEVNVLDEDADAESMISQLSGIFAKKLMLIHVANQTMAPMPDYQFRYRLLVDQYTVAEKIRRGLLKQDSDFSGEELRLDRKFNLRENVAAGRLPYQFPLTSSERLAKETVIRIVEVGRHIAVIAAGSVADPTLQSDVGPRITVPEGEKVVLFDIASDQPAANANQTFIVVDRDQNQPSYLNLNTWCLGFFPPFLVPEQLWIPTPNEMYIHARSVVGETDFHIRYKYARCKLTLIDKIRWNLDMDPSEVATADKLDLWDRIYAGVVVNDVGKI